MKTSTRPTFRTLALLGATVFALTGCLTREEGDPAGPVADGQSAFLVSELDQMGQGLEQVSPDLAKTAAPDLVVAGELVLSPFAYREACGCFVREARYTGQKGYERTRIDSVAFLDSAGMAMDAWRPARAARIVYRRDVVNTLGARQADVRIDLAVDLETRGGARVGVWNGALSGTLDGQELRSGTVTEVVRPLAGRRFGFPESGLVEATRPVFRFRVEFLGGGRAKATLTNRRNGRVHVLWVDADYAETAAPAEE